MIVIFVEFIDQLIDYPINCASLSNPSLIRVFAALRKKPCVFVNSLSPQRRPWSDWVEFFVGYACHYADVDMVSLIACMLKNEGKMEYWLHK